MYVWREIKRPAGSPFGAMRWEVVKDGQQVLATNSKEHAIERAAALNEKKG